MYLKNKTIQDSCVVFIFGNVLFWYSLSSHYNGPTVEWKMSPSLFPILISVFIVLLSISLFFDGIGQVKKAINQGSKESESAASKDLKIKPVLMTVLLSIAYFVLMRFITFIPATILYLGGMTLFLGERRYWLIALIAVICTMTIYVLFDLFLGVMLP